LHEQLNQARRELNEVLGSVRGRPGFAPRGPDNGGNVRRAETPASGGRGATALAVAATEGGDASASRIRTPTIPPALTAPTAQEIEARRAMLARAAEARNPSVEAFIASAVQTPPTQEQLVRAAYRLNIPTPELEAMIRAARTQQQAAAQ